MKILIATFTYPPEVNGVSEVAHSHASGLARRGHEVTIATAVNEKRNLKKWQSDGIKVGEFNVKGNGNLRIGYSGEIEKYQEFIASANVDVMLFHCWQIWSTDLAISKFSFNRAKKILVSHGVSANTILSPKNILNWLCWRPYVWKMRRMLEEFDHIVFLANKSDKDRFYDRWLIQKLGLKNWSIIPNGTYLEQFDTAIDNFRSIYEIGDADMLLCVSNYDRNKNQEKVLRAYLKASPKNSVLVFIGNELNNYSRKLQRIYKRCYSGNKGGPKVLFLDKLKKEMVDGAYRAADLFLFSSKTEVQPLAVLEAMASSTPFISTDVGCVSDFPGGVVVSSEREMANMMLTLLGDSQSREELAKAGRAVCVEKYDWDKIVDGYESLIKKLLI